MVSELKYEKLNCVKSRVECDEHNGTSFFAQSKSATREREEDEKKNLI